VSRDFDRFPVPSLGLIARDAGDDPHSTVYVSRAAGKIIVCPTASIEKGFYNEQEPLSLLPWDSPAEVLGQNVWESLLLFRKTPGLNLGSSKKSDWPAYRASSVKSIREFEDKYARVSVIAFPCVLRVEATVPGDLAEGLFVGRAISNACEFEQLGDLIRLSSRCSVRIADEEFGEQQDLR
jgi:hypothetical protein